MKYFIITNKKELTSRISICLILLTSVFYLTACKCFDEENGVCGDENAFSLSVIMDGTGSGRVTSSPDGIDCETDCSEAYEGDTQVTLTALPYSGNNFAGWSGGCSGTGSCTLSMDADVSVTAVFNLNAVDALQLTTPYVNEADMLEIRNGFSSDEDNPPWGYVHDGFDIYPKENLKPFQAACSGRVLKIFKFSEQVTLLIACNPDYTLEYNFEAQAPDTGQIQLDNIDVVEGQEVVQGDIIGSLYSAENLDESHVHFSLYKNAVPACPEPYFTQSASVSMLKLINEVFVDAQMCFGGEITPAPMVTPYLNEFEMTEIQAGFSSENSFSPWGFVNEGIDIYPQGDLKAFRASCAGTADTVQLEQAGVDSNWRVRVLINCDNYVDDFNEAGYFIPLSIDYSFEIMSDSLTDGQIQLTNILVTENQQVSQGELIGYLNVAGEGAHVQFNLLQFGHSEFIVFGVTSIPLCPQAHFSAQSNISILNLLHLAWPSASMCYQY